ncbi:Iron-sulfur assembly protein 2 [Spathaspora sp. JA1]|nr:Iron-sulfur assembly protein 2 [Spathaspora sp. JA1]
MIRPRLPILKSFLRYTPIRSSTSFRQFTRLNSSSVKTLKPSSFALPKSDPNVKGVGITPEGISKDEFKMTKLIHGDTDLSIGITERARDKLNEIASSEEDSSNSVLRIKVESGGCHGFQYNLELSNLNKELSEDDELYVFDREGGKIALDDSSLTILQDSKLDYTHELIGSQFKIVESPYTSTACGCGSSFDFDFEKLEQKQKQTEKK